MPGCQAADADNPLMGRMTYPVGGTIEVTSPYGPRDTDVDGTAFHKGVDFGADYGDPIYAAADGVVIVAGWVTGFGNAVYIDHGYGLVTIYGHNEQLLVLEGAYVTQGQPIALAGSTGFSYGPHCHFQVEQNETPVDPALYLSGLPAANGWSWKTDALTVPFNFDASFDFAKPIRDVIKAFGEACTKGLGFIKETMNKIFMVLMTIDLAMAALMAIFQDDNGGIAKWLIYKTMFYGLLVFMLGNWGSAVANAFRDYAVTLGSGAMGVTTAEAADVVSDPTAIVQEGAKLIAPILNHLSGLSWAPPFNMFNLPIIAATLLLALGILLCFTLVGIQIAITYIEFYMISLFSFMSFALSGEKRTRAFAANGLNSIFYACVKLMFFVIFALIMNSTMKSITVDDYFSDATEISSVGTMIKGQAISNIDEFQRAIKQVETGGESDPYNTPSQDGYGFGAYQISYDNWDSWCKTAGVVGPINANTGEPEWTPENQDRVARCMMLIYYQEYGNWHDVAVAWNGGSGAVSNPYGQTEAYWAKVQNALGHSIDRSVNISLLVKLLLAAMMFVIMGSWISKTILRELGSFGFRFSDS
jgi:P-type conjugative transfer protein TrbL